MSKIKKIRVLSYAGMIVGLILFLICQLYFDYIKNIIEIKTMMGIITLLVVIQSSIYEVMYKYISKTLNEKISCSKNDPEN